MEKGVIKGFCSDEQGTALVDAENNSLISDWQNGKFVDVPFYHVQVGDASRYLKRDQFVHILLFWSIGQRFKITPNF